MLSRQVIDISKLIQRNRGSVRKYVLPVLAAALLAFAIFEAVRQQRPEPDLPPPVIPPSSPYGDVVAGVGIVEPSTDSSGTGNISVGSQVSGVVSEVQVKIASVVKRGDVLFELDQRQARANLRVQESILNVARSQLQKLKMQPRPEEIPPIQAQVEMADANLKQMKDQFDRGKKLVKEQAVTEEEYISRFEKYQSAVGQLELAKANLALLKSGAWELDIAIAKANAEQAESQVSQAQTMLELLTVRAPVDGTILQINIRPGEYVSTLGGQSLIVMGNLNPLHVRVNVDEEDLPRLVLNASARAKLRGDPSQNEIPMTFVRLEPSVVPKTSLTGDNIERVDTRVVQTVYSIDPQHPLVLAKKVLVGQLLDVYIDTTPLNPGEQSAAKSKR